MGKPDTLTYTECQIVTAFRRTVLDYPATIQEEEWQRKEFPKLLKYFLEQLRATGGCLDSLRYNKLLKLLFMNDLLVHRDEDKEPLIHVDHDQNGIPSVCCHGPTISEAVDTLPQKMEVFETLEEIRHA